MKPLLLLAAATSLAAATPGLFDYPRNLPTEVEVVRTETRSGIIVRDVTFANLSGGRTAAYLVLPATSKPHPGILFVHWLEDGAPNSNRTQFLDQAVRLAQAGAESLLVETMWSVPGWFRARRQADDFANSVRQTKELRRALDILSARPGVDSKRLAYVGHDFGGMFGTVVAGVDKRVKFLVVMAATTSFSDWYLLYPRLEGSARQQFIDQLSVLDPVKFIAKVAPTPVLFQFAKSDRFVPLERAGAYFAAAKKPKDVLYYDAGHELNAQAEADREKWLRTRLKLPPL